MTEWIYPPAPHPDLVSALALQLSTRERFPHQLAGLLVQRGIDDFSKARGYLKPDLADLHPPEQMRGMDQAVDRILRAMRNEEKILIYGDYDVDGTTSVALMQRFFAVCGYDFPYYIPDRYTEGYGISYQGVDFAANNGVGLVIALDCGTKAVDKLRYARAKGIDYIVVDHHTPGDELPPVVAMLNPRHPDCGYPFKELPACGLALKLAQAVVRRLHNFPAEFPLPPDFDPVGEYADLVCLSVACDIVPLTGENRILAYHGLRKLRKAPSPGLKALMDLAEFAREWNVSDLVFFLGPRINSAGRLGSARDAVRLLLGRGNDLPEFAAQLHAYNDERKKLDAEITQEALEMIARDPEEICRKSTVLYHPAWHKGVIGIVASRLIERHYRPTILLTRAGEKLVGSGRSVSGFDLYAALEACSGKLVQFGGHKYAAGLTLDPAQFINFREQFEAEVSGRIQPEQEVPRIRIAADLAFREINPRLIRLIRRFGPFGPANGEPVFVARDVEVVEVRILKEEHVRFLLRQHGASFEAIGFSLAYRWQEIDGLRLDIAYQPAFKTWKGRTYIQLKIKDIKPATSSD
ncbi:MAG: single-stranded-DNA-specific exonuclease RecJ [Bacteroidota bacterium]